MKIFRGKTIKEYKDVSLRKFLSVFDSVVSQVSASNPILFPEVCDRLAKNLKMTRNDIVRVIAILLVYSYIFRKMSGCFHVGQIKEQD